MSSLYSSFWRFCRLRFTFVDRLTLGWSRRHVHVRVGNLDRLWYGMMQSWCQDALEADDARSVVMFAVLMFNGWCV